MNVVTISGRIGKAPEPKTTPSGVNAALFSIAVDRKDKQGNKVTDWFNCTAYGKTAEFVLGYFKSGSGIEVVGSLQTRSWVKEDGQKASATLIMVDRVSFPVSTKQDKPNDMPFEV